MKKKTWDQFIQQTRDEINRTAPSSPCRKDDFRTLSWDEFIEKTRYDIEHDDKELLQLIAELKEQNKALSEHADELENENRVLKDRIGVLEVENATPTIAEIIPAEVEFPIKDKLLAQKITVKTAKLLKKWDIPNSSGYIILKELIDASLHDIVNDGIEGKQQPINITNNYHEKVTFESGSTMNGNVNKKTE